MNDIQRALERVTHLRLRGQAMHAAAAEIDQEARTSFERLGERIRAGETTGDRLRDYLISRLGEGGDQFYPIYHKMMDRCATHLGEPLLMIVRNEGCPDVCVGFGHQPHPRDYRLEVILALGILKHPGFLLNPVERTEEFVVNPFVVFAPPVVSTPVAMNLPAAWKRQTSIGWCLDRPIHPPVRGSYPPSEKLVQIEIKIGRDEIHAWKQECEHLPDGREFLWALEKMFNQLETKDASAASAT